MRSARGSRPTPRWRRRDRIERSPPSTNRSKHGSPASRSPWPAPHDLRAQATLPPRPGGVMTLYPSAWLGLSQTAFALRHVQVGPWRTRVLTAGPAGGEAVVLMHGTGGHLEAYAQNIAAFAAA